LNVYTIVEIFVASSVLALFMSGCMQVREEGKQAAFGCFILITLSYALLACEMPSITEMQYYRSRIVLHMAYLLIILAWFRYYVQDFLRQSVIFADTIGMWEGQCLAAGLARETGEKLISILFLGICMFAAWILYTGTLDEKLDLLELEVILYFELCGEICSAVASDLGWIEGCIERMSLCMLFALAGIAFAAVNTRRVLREEKNRSLQKRLFQKYRESEKVYQKQKEVLKLRHDLSNHLMVLASLEAQNKRKEKAAYRKLLEEYYQRISIAAPEEVESEEEGEDAPQRTDNIIWRIISVLGSGVIVLCIFYGKFLLGVLGGGILGYCVFLATALGKQKKLCRGIQKRSRENEENERKINEMREELYAQADKEKKLTCGEILKICDSYLDKAYTGNAALDAMLASKLGQYKEHGIETEVKILAGYSPDMNAMDLVELYGNLLDNAMESCLRCKRERYISVKMWKEANFWILRIENSKPPNEHPKRYNFLTLKEDKGIHGVGLKVVRDIIQKYDGAFHTEDKGKRFVVLAMISEGR
jgi:hypothetical protein